jgi:hypothetical protein
VNGRFTTLKADGASRDLDMLPSVEEALRQQMEETKGQGRYMFSAPHLRLGDARAGRRAGVGGTDVRSRHDEDALCAVWEVHSPPDAAGRDMVRRGTTASEGEKCKPSLEKPCAHELERDTGLEPTTFALARQSQRTRHALRGAGAAGICGVARVQYMP